MKYILKSKKEPAALIAYRKGAKQGVKTSYAGYVDKDLDTEEDKPLKKSIGNEQGWICCYCNQRIEVNAMTVEHYITQKKHISSPYTQAKHTNNELNYKNLLGSCNNSERNCSGIRGNIFLQYINPLDKNCEEKLSYRKKIKPIEIKDSSGNITKQGEEVVGYEIYVLHGVNQVEMQKEIDEILQLNTDALCKAREVGIRKIQQKLHKENVKNWTNEMIDNEIREVLKLKKIDTKGNMGFSPFCMAVVDYLRSKIKK